MNLVDMISKVKGLDFTPDLIKITSKNLRPGIVEQLAKKEIFIPEGMLEKRLRSELEDKDDLQLTKLLCLEDCISCVFQIEQYGGSLLLELDIIIQSMTINQTRQEIVFKITRESLQGNNFVGRIGAFIVRAIVKSIFDLKSVKSSLWQSMKIEVKDNVAICSLENMGFIKSLQNAIPIQKKIPVLGQLLPQISTLDIVNISTVSHCKGGLTLHGGKSSPQVNSLFDLVSAGIKHTKSRLAQRKKG